MTKKVNSKNDVKLGPSRTEYTTTKQGESEIATFLESALVNVDIQQFAFGIAFTDILPRKKVTTLLKQRYNVLKESANFLRSLPTDELSRNPFKHPELVGLWADSEHAKIGHSVIGTFRSLFLQYCKQSSTKSIVLIVLC